MKNKNLKKKTIRLTAGVVALTTLAPLVNPIIPSFSNINQNKALAADEETGRVIYTNPNPNGTKDSQGTINNAISKIEILDGENENKKILKISIADGIELKEGDEIILQKEGGGFIRTKDLRFKNNIIARVDNQYLKREDSYPRYDRKEKPQSWETFFNQFQSFNNSDKPESYYRIQIVFNKNIEQYNKNRYIKVEIFQSGGINDLEFYYKEDELTQEQLNKMKIDITKKVKLIMPSGSKEDLFGEPPIRTIFRQVETYSKNTRLGEVFAMASKGWGAYLPPELKIEESKTPIDAPSFSKNHLLTRSILQDSEIGKTMFSKGTVFNLKTENSYYSVNALYNKKVGDIVEGTYAQKNAPTYENAFIENTLTPLYISDRYGSDLTIDKIKFKILKNDDTGVSLELIEDVVVKGNYTNKLHLPLGLNRTKDNLIDLVGEDKYYDFLENKTEKKLVNDKAKATLSIIEPGQQEKILATQIGETLVKQPDLAYGESSRGTIKVKYVDDKTGKEIKESETLYNNLFWKTRYNITPPKISKYKFISSNYTLRGLVGEGEKTITLRYESVSEDELAKITVKYINEQGQEIKAPTMMRMIKGENYTIDKPIIKNYVFKESSKPLTGTLNENTEINLVYKKGTQTLTVKHIDIDTGAEIADKVSETKEVGYAYTITPLQHEKYDYVEASESLTGNLESNKEITLKYRKKSKTITVNYVDEKGNKIKDPSTLTKKIDEEYNIEKPEIQNYTFKSSSKPLTGTITDNDNITLTYSKDEKTLTVKYIHRSDNGEVEIKESKTEKLEFDKDYSVDKPEIAGYKFKEADSDLTGKLTDNKVIKLYYSKYVPGPEGDKGEPGDKGQPGDKGDKGESGKDNGGSPGRESETPDIRIDPKTGNWIVNGKDTGIRVFVKNGKDGKDGKDGNTDYNKVYIHYVDYDGNKTKDSEVVDKNKLQDKLKDGNPQIAKEKDGNIIVVNKDKDNKDNKADNIIKYNIVSDKGEELSLSVYLSSKAEKPKPEIKGYKYLRTEKVSDTEERVIYTKDAGEKSKDQFTGDITYRLVDQDNKPITTVYYKDDTFQPELDGYKFKEKKKVSDKEYMLVYQKVNSNKDQNQLDKNKDTQSKDKEVSTKLKSIVKDEDGNILDTQYLEKDVHPTIDGYKYKETKEIDKETQELIYTKDKVELKKADVKTGIENVSGSLFALFGTLLLGGLALMFKRGQNK